MMFIKEFRRLARIGLCTGALFLLSSGFADAVAYKGKPKTIPKRLTAEDDRVAMEAESDADLINGNHYHNHYHYLFVLLGGKVCEAKEYMDTKHAAEAFGDLLPVRTVS